MAIPGSEARTKQRCGEMPDSLFRENLGLVVSVFGFLYGIMIGALGYLGKKFSKLRDHDEDIRRLTAMQADTAEILTGMRNDHSAEVHERREEDGRIYARIETIASRYDAKFDELKEALYQTGLKIERAIRDRNER